MSELGLDYERDCGYGTVSDARQSPPLQKHCKSMSMRHSGNKRRRMCAGRGKLEDRFLCRGYMYTNDAITLLRPQVQASLAPLPRILSLLPLARVHVPPLASPPPVRLAPCRL